MITQPRTQNPKNPNTTMGTKFSAAKLKVQLNVASKRMQGKMNKLANQVKKDRRSISRLLVSPSRFRPPPSYPS